MEALHEKIAKMELDTSEMKLEDVVDRLRTRRIATRRIQVECARNAPTVSYVGDWMGKISNSWKDAITDSVVAVKDPYSCFDWRQFPKCKFGHMMRDQNFFFDPDTLFFSASTVTAVARPVIECRYNWDQFVHADTTVFRVTQLDNEIVRFRHKLSSRFSVPTVEHVMLVPSAEAGIMAVWNSQIWEAGDILLLFDCDGKWTKAAANALHDKYDVEIMMLPDCLSKGQGGMVAQLTDFLRTYKPRLVHIPHVAPESGFVLPVSQLVSACHSFSLPVCVNGELATGQFKLSVTDINADYYIGAHHHWLHSFPIAFVYTANPKVSPVGNSYFYGASVQTQFSYTGLLDFTSWITSNVAQGFIKRTCGGLSAQYKYTQSLAKNAAKLLVEALETELFCDDKSWVLMPCVRLPNTGGAGMENATELMRRLMADHRVTVQISRLMRGERPHLYVLVCVQIYHEPQDFVRLAECLKSVLQNFQLTPSHEQEDIVISPDKALRRSNQTKPSEIPGVFGDYYLTQSSAPLISGLEECSLPLPCINWHAYGCLPIPFGEKMKSMFYMPTNKVFMNCGSFGCAPRPVVDARHALDIMMQRRPGVFQNHNLNQLVGEATRLLSKEIGSEPDQLVLVENCNTATSIVLSGFTLTCPHIPPV